VRSQRPNIIRIREGLYRLDLRGKTFARVLQTVADGKKTLNFTIRAGAERKANEIENLLVSYPTKEESLRFWQITPRVILTGQGETEPTTTDGPALEVSPCYEGTPGGGSG
jgi:hypothetical protein